MKRIVAVLRALLREENWVNIDLYLMGIIGFFGYLSYLTKEKDFGIQDILFLVALIIEVLFILYRTLKP